MVGTEATAKISKVFLARLITALLQAAALYLLTDAAAMPRTWPATDIALFSPMLLIASFVPLLALFGIGQIRARPLAIWLAAAAIVIAALGYHDATRGRAPAFATQEVFWPWFGLWLALSASLFIAHTLVADAIVERRLMPSYTRHFDTAWKHGVQIALTLLFDGVFWGVLHLGAWLFVLVNIRYFNTLLGERWFIYPANTLAIAVAIHVTDVQPSLIRGARTLALTLFSWLLPLLVFILCGFVVSLPFVSLATLWKTHFATGTLLIAAGLLVFLINCCYQDGNAERTGSRIKQVACNVGALVLVAMVALACFALNLRIAQYGWTTERVLAEAITVIAACYALAYAGSVLRRRAWLKGIDKANVIVAYLILATVLALFSPLADPARLMVADQVARLKSGVTPPEKFDFGALKFDGARWGAEALRNLSQTTEMADAAIINKRARDAIAQASRIVPPTPLEPVDVADRIAVYPAGRTLPANLYDLKDGPFSLQMGRPMCLLPTAKVRCVARFLTLGPGQDEAILFLDTYGARILTQTAPDRWTTAAFVSGNVACASVRKALETGEIPTIPHAMPDIMADGRRLTLEPVMPIQPCNPPAK